jgi:hypothetical protein
MALWKKVLLAVFVVIPLKIYCKVTGKPLPGEWG